MMHPKTIKEVLLFGAFMSVFTIVNFGFARPAGDMPQMALVCVFFSFSIPWAAMLIGTYWSRRLNK